MAAEIIAGLGAIKTAFDLAKGLKEINDTATRNAAVIELQQKILAAQEAQSALIERIRNLEIEIASFETWQTEKDRYKLTDFGAGTFAYLLRPKAANGEPPHRLCASCFHEGHKSILQFSAKSEGQDWFECFRCKTRQAFGIYSSRNYDDGGEQDFMTS